MFVTFLQAYPQEVAFFCLNIISKIIVLFCFNFSSGVDYKVVVFFSNTILSKTLNFSMFFFKLKYIYINRFN